LKGWLEGVRALYWCGVMRRCGSSPTLLRAWYDLGDGYGLVLSVVDGMDACILPGDGISEVVLPLSIVEADIYDSLLAEAVASLTLAPAERIDGDRGLLDSLAARYVKRIACEEYNYMQKLMGLMAQHARIADVGVPAIRISKLFRVNLWLRDLYRRTLLGRGASRLRRLVGEALGVEDRWVPLDLLSKNCNSHRMLLGERLAKLTRLAFNMLSPSLLHIVPASLLFRSISAKGPGLLRDPLLYVKLDKGRMATRLIPFEKQLYAITGVAKASSERTSLLRSTLVVKSTGGFKPAVVKRYRDITSAKWIMVAAASIYLSKPRTRPRQRLQAEYHYNLLVGSMGFNVPEPLLIDPRRMMAAYVFIEGKNLLELLQHNPAPPEYREYGRLLAELHGKGIVLWDSNPSNVIKHDNELYIVDLEQARESKELGDRALDIAVASYYSIPYSPLASHERARMLAEGYIEGGGDAQVLLEASKYRYAALFLAGSPPQVLEKTRRSLLHVYRSHHTG